MIGASSTFSKCLIWLAALLSPIQSLQGMHLFCSHGAVCSGDHEIAQPQTGRSCCCKAESRRDREEGTRAVDGCNPFLPCPCPPSCWCHRRGEPQLPSQQPVELRCSVEMLGQSVDVTSVTLSSCFPHAVEADSEPAFTTAQQVCATLCRFLA